MENNNNHNTDENTVQLGRMNRLRVLRRVEFGLYLDAGERFGDVLLPARYAPADANVDDELEVFLYLDHDERLVATTERPLAQVGDFAYLEVAWVNNYGAFLRWGPMKDLFVPFREQKMKMRKGERYMVHLHVDGQSHRIVASAKIDRYLSQDEPPYRKGDKVEALVWQKTELGLKVIIDNRFAGLLYDDQLFRQYFAGDRLQAYVSQVRPDGKIDLMAQPVGHGGIQDFSDTLLQYLQAHNGLCPLGDKSPADEIYNTFGVSKKLFKKAVGDLYRRRMITLTDEGIILVNEE